MILDLSENIERRIWNIKLFATGENQNHVLLNIIHHLVKGKSVLNERKKIFRL